MWQPEECYTADHKAATRAWVGAFESMHNAKVQAVVDAKLKIREFGYNFSQTYKVSPNKDAEWTHALQRTPLRPPRTHPANTSPPPQKKDIATAESVLAASVAHTKAFTSMVPPLPNARGWVNYFA